MGGAQTSGAQAAGGQAPATGLQNLEAAYDLKSEVFPDPDTYYMQSVRLSWTPAARSGSEQRVFWGEHHHVKEQGTLSEPLGPGATTFVLRDFNGPMLFWRVLTKQGNRWVASADAAVDEPEERFIRTSDAEGPPGPPPAGEFCEPIIQDISPDFSNLDPNDPDGASSGRVNGLANDASDNAVYYAASEWGGVFKSTDFGLNWARLTGHLPRVCWDVEVDPSNPLIVYATSFHDGRVSSVAGIQVSYDAGATWSKPASATPINDGGPNDNTPQAGYFCNQQRIDEPSAWGISIDAATPSNVYIGTSCGLAISLDSGVTWTFVDPTQGTAGDVMDVVAQPGIIDVVGAGGLGHRRSTDGGLTWSINTLPTGGRSIDVSPDESYVLFVAGTDNNLYESDDGGATWTLISSCDPNSPQGRIPFVKVNDQPGTAFDVWTGDVSLFRAPCTTPAAPAPGGANRCPGNASWFGGFTRNGIGNATGAHDDVGDIVFDSQQGPGAVPRLYSGDGGVYFAQVTFSAPTGTNNLVWEQPLVTPHASWLYGMAGFSVAGDPNENVQYACQDIGGYANTTVGFADPVPFWNNWFCCDAFDTASEDDTALMSVGAFGGQGRTFRMFLGNPGFGASGEINTYPAGGLITAFRFAESVDTWGNDRYVMLTNDCIAPDNVPAGGDGVADNGCPGPIPAGSDGGVFITTDITAGAIVWTELGNATEPPSSQLVEVQASTAFAQPVFFVSAGGGNARSADSLWRFNGTNPAGVWQRIDNNIPGAFGVSVWSVAPSNANLLYACALTVGGPAMFSSTDGGATWQPDTDLDGLMTGFGTFQYQTSRGPTEFTGFGGYPQPSLLAHDPLNPNNIAAGGRDSGVFLSRDGGASWRRLTDPVTSDTSGQPHVSRPHFAHFDQDAAVDEVRLIVGTHGMGVWRFIVGLDQPRISVPGGLSFADTCVGESRVQTLNVCNVGKCQLEIYGITSTDPQFSVDDRSSGFPLTIEPGSCYPFQARFTPTTGAARQGTLMIESNDPSEATLLVPVDGAGSVADIATVMSDNGDFGNVCLGDFHDLNLSILNNGDCDLVVSNITSSSPQFVVATVMSFPISIGPGNRQLIPIRFEPLTGFGARNATISVFSNDVDTPQKDVPVSGNVPPPDITVVGSPDFGIVCPDVVEERTFQVCNTGLCTLNVLSAALDANCVDFTIISNRFPDAVSHDFCLDLIVRYTPQTVGTHTCDLTITSDDPDENPVVIQLTGTTPPVLIDVPDDLTFPPTVIQEVDPECMSMFPFAITNLGLCNAQILDVVVEEDPNYPDPNWDDFQLENVPNLPLTLQPGHRVGNGQAKIVFRPEAVAHRIRARVAITYVDHDPMVLPPGGVPGPNNIETVYVLLCGEGVRTGARVLAVNGNGIPLPIVNKITLWQLTGGAFPLEVVFDKTPFFLPADPPCPEILYHWGWGTELNPDITLEPGDYTAELAVYGVGVRTVDFTIEDRCHFIDTLTVVFPNAP